MTLNVLGGMNQQPEHRGWQLRSSDSSMRCQRSFVGGAKFGKRTIHLLSKFLKKDGHAKIGTRHSLGLKRIQLIRIERLAACVRKQSIENAPQMLQVKTDGGHAAGASPQEFFGKAGHHRFNFFARLQERMGDGLQQRRHIRQGATQPDLRDRWH
jgi:hypothetical protein